MTSRRAALALLAALALASPAAADHPGEDIDAAMTEREELFQAIDRAAPDFSLVDAEGKPVSLSDFSDKIVVLNFMFASCPDVCPLHAETIAELQERIDATPLGDIVQFVSITTDPAADTAEVLEGYGDAHGLDPRNWTVLTARPDQAEDATRTLAEDYGLVFSPTSDGGQMHGVVTHVIDRGGRWAAKFHGLRFDPVNLVLYVNELNNNAQARLREDEPGWWDRVRGLF